jgi:DNA-binding beta-propeller fold protein YncE
MGVILSVIFPIHVDFQPQPELSIGLALLSAAAVGFGTLTLRPPILYAGVALILSIATIETITQPSLLSVPITAIWPARVSMVLLIGVIWALLMRPPSWLERAIMGFVAATILLLVLWGGPATGASLFGWQLPVSNINFAPNFLAVDSHNTLYASSATGGLIWVFDESGSPKGTLRPGKAPAVPTPGPGILPNGMEEELGLSALPAATPVGQLVASTVPFYVCGMAVDAQDNLYTVDAQDPTGPKLLRFDRDGMITARWALPEGYAQGFYPGQNCLEADGEHIYLTTFVGKLYVMDFEGHVQRMVNLPERPFDQAATGNGELLLLGSEHLERVQVETGEVITMTLPLPEQHQRQPYGAMVYDGKGQVAVTDLASNRVLRIDLESNSIVGSFAGFGYQPGQLVAPSGLAMDKQGRIYVADGKQRVVQRFTVGGKIDSLLWAALSFPEGPQQQVEID